MAMERVLFCSNQFFNGEGMAFVEPFATERILEAAKEHSSEGYSIDGISGEAMLWHCLFLCGFSEG